MEKTRPAIVEPILTELFHSVPAVGEEQARLFAQRILTEGEEAFVFLSWKSPGGLINQRLCLPPHPA
ncbi:MAG TPA: hypothetical protein PLH79_00835 [bacterium]|nr:hypothetical protein [Candidatus Omnitrophota bacterium]HOL92867.1 hypothetical protein [bacterium]HPP01241.1 hypothetical protein [bacterium]HXK94980.1 hypothetical protein [bacterium]